MKNNSCVVCGTKNIEYLTSELKDICFDCATNNEEYFMCPGCGLVFDIKYDRGNGKCYECED